MKDYRFIFAGFGGQGVLFSGKVTAYTALIDGLEVTWMPSYGPEMRGGTANCAVCISEQQIGSPLVSKPNILVAMNNPSFVKFINAVEPGGQVFIDSSLVDLTTERKDITVHAVPATQLANDSGLHGIANIILLGKVLKETKFTELDVLEKALGKCVPERNKHLLEHNIRAVKLGMEQ